MVNEQPLNVFLFYPVQAVQVWLQVLGIGAAVLVVLSFVYSSVTHMNPIEGLKRTVRSIFEGIVDIAMLPFGMRRIWAMAKLSIKESIRRRILYVFVLFLVPFLFAGWYLPNSEEGQIRFLVAFTNSAITWILLPLVVFVVSMNLPTDIKQKTIQTVVTKPIRRLEIVAGRVMGFMIIFTGVLVIMGGVSIWYLWGNVTPEVRESQWTARVPIYARPPSPEANALMFQKGGQWQYVGTDVGKEFRYRSHIAGATGDSAHWYFYFDPAMIESDDTVTIEMSFDIFKTTKGDPTREGAESSGVFATIQIKEISENPNDANRPLLYSSTFRVNNNRKNILGDIPATVFESGQIEVIAQCLTPSQFIGMAAGDLYILATERSFAVNYLKGLIAVWLKALLLTCVAVTASTVLNGFVTILLTTMVYMLGFWYTFLIGVVQQTVLGGGPVESLIRLVTQNNQQSALDPGFFSTWAGHIDTVVLKLMGLLAQVIPNLSTIDTVEYVASGFDIDPRLLIANAALVFGYVLPVIILGYFMLKSREIATA